MKIVPPHFLLCASSLRRISIHCLFPDCRSFFAGHPLHHLRFGRHWNRPGEIQWKSHASSRRNRLSTLARAGCKGIHGKSSNVNSEEKHHLDISYFRLLAPVFGKHRPSKWPCSSVAIASHTPRSSYSSTNISTQDRYTSDTLIFPLIRQFVLYVAPTTGLFHVLKELNILIAKLYTL